VIAADDAPIFLELLMLKLSSVPEVDLIATAENGRSAQYRTPFSAREV